MFEFRLALELPVSYNYSILRAKSFAFFLQKVLHSILFYIHKFCKKNPHFCNAKTILALNYAGIEHLIANQIFIVLKQDLK